MGKLSKDEVLLYREELAKLPISRNDSGTVFVL